MWILPLINGNYAILGGLKVAEALAVETADSMACRHHLRQCAVP